MDDQGLSLQELVAIVRRRLGRFVLTALILLAAAVPVSVLWPPVYRSTATILIEEQEIPRDLVRSTVTSFADERIQVITQQVMTRATLLQIVEKYNLYGLERRYLSNEEILERMRRDVKIETISAEGGGRFGGRAAAIAFKLSYDNARPDQAQKVANELVTLYLNENLRTRRQRSEETSSFLGDEAERLGKQIDDIEARLAEFKRANAGRLPELQTFNLQMRERAETEIDDVARQIRLLEDRKVYIESQMAVVKESAPISNERVLEPDERLRLLRNQYASLSAVYSPAHPDITRMQREIATLERSTGAKAAPNPRALEDARNELGRLSERYAADHPDVVRQAKRVAALEAEQAALPASAARKPDNPAYVSLAAQVESAVREAESLRKRREELRERVAAYDARLQQTPSVEQAYRDLVRDHESATAKYKELRSKQMEAQVAQTLEKDRKGERFSLIDPPQLPDRPYKPSRALLLAFSFVIALGGGAGAAGVAEALDRSVKSPRKLAELLETPVLGVLPRTENDAQRENRRRRWLLALGALAVLGMAALAAVHLLVMPLDSLWYALLRRLQF
jgi:uncharacterized protein involved in exopolysaccharide biosynthesis